MFEKSIQSIIDAFAQQRKPVKTKTTVSSSHCHVMVSLTPHIRWHSLLADWGRTSLSGPASDRISRHRESKYPVPIMTCTHLVYLADRLCSHDLETNRSQTGRFCSTWIALSRYGFHVPHTALTVSNGSTKAILITSASDTSGKEVQLDSG